MKKKKLGFIAFFKDVFEDTYMFLFRKKKHVKLGLYGAPNSGKTTLANRMCQDWIKEETGAPIGVPIELGKTSRIPHETKQLQSKEKIDVKLGRKTLSFTIIDTPGIATTIDYEEFIKHGMRKGKARKWAREATKGVIESIKSLDEMDAVIIVIDASKDPYHQVNLTIVGNLAVRKIPFMIVANKIDLRRADPKKVENAFLDYDFVEISAKQGRNMEKFYKTLYEVVR